MPAIIHFRSEKYITQFKLHSPDRWRWVVQLIQEAWIAKLAQNILNSENLVFEKELTE